MCVDRASGIPQALLIGTMGAPAGFLLLLLLSLAVVTTHTLITLTKETQESNSGGSRQLTGVEHNVPVRSKQHFCLHGGHHTQRGNPSAADTGRHRIRIVFR